MQIIRWCTPRLHPLVSTNKKGLPKLIEKLPAPRSQEPEGPEEETKNPALPSRQTPPRDKSQWPTKRAPRREQPNQSDHLRGHDRQNKPPRGVTEWLARGGCPAQEQPLAKSRQGTRQRQAPKARSRCGWQSNRFRSRQLPQKKRHPVPGLNWTIYSSCSFAKKNRRNGLDQYSKILPDGPSVNVCDIKFHPLIEIGNVTPATDLPKTGDSGLHAQTAAMR